MPPRVCFLFLFLLLPGGQYFRCEFWFACSACLVWLPSGDLPGFFICARQMSQRAHSSYSHEGAFDGMNILPAVFFFSIRALFVKRLVLDTTLPRRLYIVGWGGACSKDVFWR